jgi:hypothetical protein
MQIGETLRRIVSSRARVAFNNPTSKCAEEVVSHTEASLYATSIKRNGHPDYALFIWWRYSQGVKDVLTEGVAYIYAKFLFWPSAAESQTDFRSQRLEIAGQRTGDGRRKAEHAKH